MITKKPILTLHNLGLAVPSLMGLALLVGVLLYPMPTDHKQPSTKSISTTTTPVTIVSSSPKTATTSKSSSPSSSTTSSIVRSSSPATVTPKPAPVVKPSPSSSVAGLTPASPSSGSSSSSSSNNASSSGSQGSDTAGQQSLSGNSLAPATGGYKSANWAGYMATSGSYTAVSASWTADSPTSNGSPLSADATWIGIGGITTGDLIQVGTDNTVNSSGQVVTSAFYEMLPSISVNIPSLTIVPGDSIQASLSETSPNVWQISINDLTSGANYSTIVSYSSSSSSAEWIEEDPSTSRGHAIAFDSFGQVNFTNCHATDNGSMINLTTGSTQPITMVNGDDQAVATPSVASSDGSYFNIYDDSGS